MVVEAVAAGLEPDRTDGETQMGVLVFLDDYRDRPISLGAAARRYVEAMMRSEGAGRAVDQGFKAPREANGGKRMGVEDSAHPPARPAFPRAVQNPGGD